MTGSGFIRSVICAPLVPLKIKKLEGYAYSPILIFHRHGDQFWLLLYLLSLDRPVLFAYIQTCIFCSIRLQANNPLWLPYSSRFGYSNSSDYPMGMGEWGRTKQNEKISMG